MQNSVGISLFVTIVMLSRCSSLVTRRMLRPATTVGSSSSSLSSTSNSGIALNARNVREKIEAKCKELGRDPSEVLLVPVSKTKPNENIMELYNDGWRHFGENYFQELLEKAEALPEDIVWHFIGHLQSGKANRLLREVTNLGVVETVDTIKLANKLNTACEAAERSEKLNIYIQVDTSGEDSKSGVSPGKGMVEMADTIKNDCKSLQITGLMTIGAPGDLTCFDKLVDCRKTLAAHWGVPTESLALSMGMSGDYLQAIERGSTSVRVGSTIFGARDYPNKAK